MHLYECEERRGGWETVFILILWGWNAATFYKERGRRERSSADLLPIPWSPLSVVSRAIAFVPVIWCAVFFFCPSNSPGASLAPVPHDFTFQYAATRKMVLDTAYFLPKLQCWKDFALYIFMLYTAYCRCNCDKLVGKMFIVSMSVSLLKGQNVYFKKRPVNQCTHTHTPPPHFFLMVFPLTRAAWLLDALQVIIPNNVQIACSLNFQSLLLMVL